MSNLIFYLWLCYLVGSLPFGLFAGFCAGLDIRQAGSGNIGFTNVLRVCGWKFGLPVLFLDALKGFVAAYWLAHWFLAGDPALPFHQVLGGLLAVVGHSFPVWLKFHGGKGVATGAGVAAAVIPLPLLVALIVWLSVVALTRYVSLGSLGAAVATITAQIVCTWGAVLARENLPALFLAVAIVAIVFLRHRANIARLRRGTENKISFARSSTKTRARDLSTN